MDDDDRFLGYVLLATRDGALGLVGDKIYGDLGQTRQLAAQHQADAGPQERYSVGAIVPLEQAVRWS